MSHSFARAEGRSGSTLSARAVGQHHHSSAQGCFNKKFLCHVKAFDRHYSMVLDDVKAMGTSVPKSGKDKISELHCLLTGQCCLLAQTENSRDSGVTPWIHHMRLKRAYHADPEDTKWTTQKDPSDPHETKIILKKNKRIAPNGFISKKLYMQIAFYLSVLPIHQTSETHSGYILGSC
ncbi:hypothetical protein E5288_WYG017779 [Bos mutus]|uniref:Uncharacterized protein n=1 Tax=Bos mutus TaxID=72004 RepID=A0A6B0RHZ7_9CETA|nr:hypothetical protein [Bos mutus]